MAGINILTEYTAGGFPAWLALLGPVVAVLGLVLLLCGICADNGFAAGIGLVAFLLFVVVTIAAAVISEPEHTHNTKSPSPRMLNSLNFWNGTKFSTPRARYTRYGR